MLVALRAREGKLRGRVNTLEKRGTHGGRCEGRAAAARAPPAGHADDHGGGEGQRARALARTCESLHTSTYACVASSKSASGPSCSSSQLSSFWVRSSAALTFGSSMLRCSRASATRAARPGGPSGADKGAPGAEFSSADFFDTDLLCLRPNDGRRLAFFAAAGAAADMVLEARCRESAASVANSSGRCCAAAADKAQS